MSRCASTGQILTTQGRLVEFPVPGRTEKGGGDFAAPPPQKKKIEMPPLNFTV